MSSTSSQWVKTSINDYAAAAQDVSDYVQDINPVRDPDSVDVTTFRTGGKSVTQAKIRGALKSEFTITFLWSPTIDWILDPLIGNNTGTLIDIRMGNGAAPTTNDDKFSGTFTLFNRRYDYSSASANPATIKVDVKPTDSSSATAPAWSKI